MHCSGLMLMQPMCGFTCKVYVWLIDEDLGHCTASIVRSRGACDIGQFMTHDALGNFPNLNGKSSSWKSLRSLALSGTPTDWTINANKISGKPFQNAIIIVIYTNINSLLDIQTNTTNNCSHKIQSWIERMLKILGMTVVVVVVVVFVALNLVSTFSQMCCIICCFQMLQNVQWIFYFN